MYIESDQIIYSPSDLTLYMDSPFASWMDHLALTNPESLPPEDPADELMTVLQHRGMELERRILNDFICIIVNDKGGKRSLWIAFCEINGYLHIIFIRFFSLDLIDTASEALQATHSKKNNH